MNRYAELKNRFQQEIDAFPMKWAFSQEQFDKSMRELGLDPADTDKIIGFECGADDYLTKPFNILELKARVRALLRRAGAAQQQRSGNELAAGHIILNTGERTASRDGVSVELTAKEFDLMELLMRNPGRVYSRENLLNVVWGYEYIGDFRTVDVHIRRLREKLELDPANPEYIRTKWGVGYYLSARGPRRLENV